ncbi:MAG: CoA-binding protein [Gammaproteobacteria bacterium]|nr:CoA-binding protein [Gammaproteobacteria bacterium]
MNDEAITELLGSVKTIAIVGLSPKKHRPSHRVAKHLQDCSYTVIPVRPGVREVLGENAYKSLEDIPFKVDLVNVFRAPKFIPGIVDSCIDLGLDKIWVQEGIINLDAQKKAQQSGIFMVMDRCIYKEIVRLGMNKLNKQ